jgi:hypothetical protein
VNNRDEEPIMDVKSQVPFSAVTSIEAGCPAQLPNSYVDIPVKCLAPIVAEVFRQGLLNPRETDIILDAALEAMYRQERGDTLN